MKQIYLLRHAKSSWSKPVADFDRGLNKRGKKDLAFMATLIRSKQIHPDLILSSPAKRAKKTAKEIGKALAISRVYYDENIYEADIEELLEIIHELDNNIHTVFIVGHNPGLNMLAEYLSGRVIDNIPTCAIYGLEFRLNDWTKVDKAQGEYLMFEYPKKYA
ncbi:MAG: SixA phosphatase family protein [Campylobacterota bacterium]